VPQLLEERRFHFRGDGVLEIMRFAVQFRPGQDPRHHPLGQHVAADHRPRGLFAGLRQARPVLVHGDQAVADHAFEGIGDGRRGHVQELRQADAQDRLFIPLEDEHERKIVLDGGAEFIHRFCPNS
jgi:hypothetical protein